MPFVPNCVIRQTARYWPGYNREICDFTNTVLQHTSILPLSRLIYIANNRFPSLPDSSILSSHCPFRITQQDSQTEISAKICRLSVTFLLVYVMGFSAGLPNNEPLLKCIWQIDVINDILCITSRWSTSDIQVSQSYFFQFGFLVKIYAATKIHHLMRHVGSHLICLGCIHRGSSEDNEMADKECKVLFHTTKKHIEYIGQHLSISLVYHSALTGHFRWPNSYNDTGDSHLTLELSMTDTCSSEVHTL